MKVLRDDKRLEAIKRMKKMNLFAPAIKQFAEDHAVMISEPPIGGLYWLNDEQKKMVQDFENEWNALVYLVVRTHTNLGTMDSLFYVSDHKEEWSMDNDDLEENCACVYVVNHDMPDCSEFGTITFRNVGGGILRVL